ncbi:MAG: xaa-Pro dipeptidase [Candidatus Micrarchaeota archaeon]|nr:MAG: xaa-Pro dipeptidase [Candidatus Micrarchaeota archaeon]
MDLRSILYNRIKRLSEQAASIDKIVIRNEPNTKEDFQYWKLFNDGVFELNYIIIDLKNKLVYLDTSPLEKDIAIYNKELYSLDNLEVLSNKPLSAIIDKKDTVGISFMHSRYTIDAIKNNLDVKEIVDVTNLLSSIRLIKDSYEIDNISKAADITKKTIEETFNELRPGLTEKDIEVIFRKNLINNGVMELAFDTIVAIDENSAMPHHMPSDKKLKENSVVLIDAGAKYNNYCGDITRTIIFKPDKSSSKYKLFEEVHSLVYKAQQEALRYMTPRYNNKKPAGVAAKIISNYKDGKFAKYSFSNIHSLGHSIGLNVHDSDTVVISNYRARESVMLQKNSVFSNEPGIYINGRFGVRIEDDILIDDTPKVL